MFDMGFLELLLIGIIALIVLGPERLPKAARTVGLWVAKAKQSFESVKTEIDRELKVQELQQQLKEQKEKIEQEAGINELKSSLEETQNALNENANSILNESNSISQQFQNDLNSSDTNTPEISHSNDKDIEASNKVSSDKDSKHD
ncbi:MAG: Sec-independent protein translocase protein TatB [Kangiellaceae bacterium]